MLKSMSLLTPITPTLAIIGLIFSIGLGLAVKIILGRNDINKVAMAAIRRRLLRYHLRKAIYINAQLQSLKILCELISEIDSVPMSADQYARLEMLSDIFKAGTLSHEAFLHFIEIQSTEMILQNIADKEDVLLKMLEGTDKERLSNNLIVQGFELMDDGLLIEDKRLRAETLARGDRWVQYGHHLNKRQAQAIKTLSGDTY